ncbi:MAG: cation:proton antiporter [Candidatus Latescibacteria bacterium]|nr:cation:proton antiporter [Candidatus Latescibacterota bacterium]
MEPNEKFFILLGLVAVAGYYIGDLARKIRLPSLLGYMLLGVLLGTSFAGLVKTTDLHHLEFITEITLGFVAFMIGTELSLVSLRRQGFGIVVIILSESFAAFFVVLGAVYLLTRDLPMALVFGAMAPASAPAGTVAVIQEYRARGSLTKALYAVVGFDDGLAIIIFGFASALAKHLLASESSGITENMLGSLVDPVLEIMMSFIFGGVLGFVLSFLIRRLSQERDYFILVFGFVLMAIGLSERYHLSLILTNMIVGIVLVNTCRESLVQKVTRQLRVTNPFLFILFFFLAGAHLNVSALPAMGMVGFVYIVGRSTGLLGGAYIGAVIGKSDEKIKKYLGFGILSQAGVAIGLSLIVSKEFALIGTEHADKIGISIITTITATCIFFEIVGPIFTKIALERSGEIQTKE